MKAHHLLYFAFGVNLVGCGGPASNEPEEETANEVSFEDLAGTQWILQNQGTQENFPTHRFRIEKDGDDFYLLFSGLRADRSTLMAWPRNWATEVNRYDCEIIELPGGITQLSCAEQGREWEWCFTALAHGERCTLEMLHVMDDSLTEEDLEAAIEVAQAQMDLVPVDRMNSTERRLFPETWNDAHYTDRSNIALEVIAEDRLKVRDTAVNFRIIRDEDGDNVVDTQPVSNGRAGFEAIPDDRENMLWESCDLERRYLSVSREEGFPSNPYNEVPAADEPMDYPLGTTLTFTHVQPIFDVRSVPDRMLSPECRYEFDVYHRGELVEAGIEGEVGTAPVQVDGVEQDLAYARIQWTNTFDEPSGNFEAHPDLVTFVITKTCPEAEPERLLACQNVTIVE